MADMLLSSNVMLMGLENISIIGHNNLTVMRSNAGGLHFLSFHNCTIKNIAWNGCSTQDDSHYAKPTILFQNSSNIAIQNCSFQHSLGQVIVMSEMSGDVNIDNCKFTNNSHHTGHGIAIHYSSIARDADHSVFTISDCSFSHNEGAISIISIFESVVFSLSLKNSVFHKNQGIPVYISNQYMHLNIHGYLIFDENTATSCGGIFVGDNSSVVFCKNSTVMFSNNVAIKGGGTIYMNSYANVLFQIPLYYFIITELLVVELYTLRIILIFLLKEILL